MKSKKLLIWTVLLILVSFSLITWISIGSLNTVIEGNDEELSKVLASKIYDSINNKLSEPIIVAQTMASDYYLIEPLRGDDFPEEEMEETLVSYLRTLSGNMGYNSAFIVSENSRTYYTQKGFNKIVSPDTDAHDIWYSLFVDSGKKYDFDVDTDEVHDNVWTVFVNCRIEDTDGSLLGVCGVSVVMTELQNMLCAYEEEYDIKINLVNQEGLVQVDTDMINIENAVLDTAALDEENPEEYVYQKQGDGGYTVSKYVENLGWYLVVQSNGENNGQIYLSLLYKNVLIFVVILVICIVAVSSNLMIEKKKMEEHAQEKEQYAREQEALKIEAESASRAKGEFLANMSHEIRTPINAVLGMDEMILRESSDPGIREYAADIKRAGTTLLLLINDILDFSKIESGKMDIIPVDYDLGTVLGDIINMIRPRMENKKLALELQIDSHTPAHLYGDEVRLRQIITNIMTNAVKYTAEGHVLLTVSGQKTEKGRVMLYVSVKDTGIGIKPEDKKKLFDAFQRVDETRNRNIEGTGLGLSITMCLLNLMGSRLQVESVYGVGSDFYFYLEQVQRDEEVIGDFTQHAKQAASTVDVYTEQFRAPNARILVVDDNEMNLKVFTGLLKNSGMQIDTAMCGGECLELMRERSYHIVFLDHLMPEMDGIEVLKKAREEKLCGDAVMVALTANAVSGAKEMFMQQGFDAYLSKPVIAPKLEGMIRRYLPGELIEQTWDGKNARAAEDRRGLDEAGRDVTEQKEAGRNEAQQEEVEQKEAGQNEAQQEEAEQKEAGRCETTQNETGQGEAEQNEAGQCPQKVLVNWDKGMELCMNDGDFYRELLDTFVHSGSDEALNRLYEICDWENYRIKVHAVKTNLASIAADGASEMAKRLEYALKNNNDIAYVQEHHDEFILMYRRVQADVEAYLGSSAETVV